MSTQPESNVTVTTGPSTKEKAKRFFKGFPKELGKTFSINAAAGAGMAAGMAIVFVVVGALLPKQKADETVESE